MSRVSRKDLNRIARNSGAALADMQQRGHSLAVCFDALVTVLDENLQKTGDRKMLLSELLKEELEKRRAAAASDKG
jgi:hypothetical protein